MINSVLIRIFCITKWINIIPIVLITSCANYQRDNCQINGNEEYLKTPGLHPLNNPSNITLPIQNNDYKIPPILYKGDVGKKLDISPPHNY